MLDENLSPTLVAPLWEYEVDTIHVRDRDLLGSEDHVLWRYASTQSRTFVTINRGDFCRLAVNEIGHPGLIVIPGGAKRDEQLDCVLEAVEWARTANDNVSPFANRLIEVSLTGDLTYEEMTLLTGSPIIEQKYIC